MDYLCQSHALNESHPTWAISSCQCDWVNTIVSLFALYIMVLVIVCLRWMRSNRRKWRQQDGLFKYHDLRACLSIVMLLIHWTELADAFLSIAPAHIFIVPSVSFAFLIILIFLEHKIEDRNSPIFLLVASSLWLVNGTMRTWRFLVLYNLGVPLYHLRPLTSALSSVICFIGSGLILFTMNHETKKLDGSRKPKEGHSKIVSYHHDKAHFFSRATFYWLNSLLFSGLKSQIELIDLGDLPESHFAHIFHRKLENILSQKKEKLTSSRLWSAFWIFVKYDFFIGGLCKLMGDMTSVVGPLGISVMVNYVAKQKNSKGASLDELNEMYPTVSQLLENGWTMAFVIFFSSIAQSTFSQASTHCMNVVSLHLKIALQSLIYTKCLRLRLSSKFIPKFSHNCKKNDSKNKAEEDCSDLGVLVNLMTNDVANIMSFFWIGHYMWAIPVKMCALIFLLYMKLGNSAVIVAAVTIAVVVPIQLLIGRRMSKNSFTCLELADIRLEHLNMLTGKMKLFKLLGWEKFYGDRILKVRRKELHFLDKDSLYWGILTFFTNASSVLVSLITFGVLYLYTDISLKSDSVFPALALFNQLMVPLFILPVIVPIIAEAIVSCRRICEFFNLPEMVTNRNMIANGKKGEKNITANHLVLSEMTSIIEEDEKSLSDKSHIKTCTHTAHIQNRKKGDHKCVDSCDGIKYQKFVQHDINDDSLRANDFQIPGSYEDFALMIANGIFAWNPESWDKNLTVKSLKVPRGGITVICGKIGSGKTSLISAILGEMPLVEGSIQWKRDMSVAYCPQTPWLLNSTIRDNIIFGSPFRTRRYEQVISLCALKADINILPRKDFTVIGENGINLSGGQRQRVAIARALYSEAAVIILDDPFSSLDFSMAVKIFEDGIKRFTRRSRRTIILVTHYLMFLADCDLVVVMDSGKIRFSGAPNDIRLSDCDLLQNWKKWALTPNNFVLKEHTAKERWQLVRSVTRSRRNSISSISDYEFGTYENNNIVKFLPMNHRQKLFAVLSEWNHVMHDLSLPEGQLDHNMLEFNSVWRKNSFMKNEVGRANSLQYGHLKVSQVIRQYSSPLTANTSRFYRNHKKNQRDFMNHFVRNQTKQCGLPIKKAVRREASSSIVSLETLDGVFNEQNDEMNQTETEKSTYKIEEMGFESKRSQIYFNYVKACGVKIAFSYFVVTLMWQILRVNTDFWLSEWIEAPLNNELTKHLYIYVFLSMGTVILSLLSHVLGQLAGSKARKTLHDLMLHNIIHSSNQIFDCLSTGRMFNRFSTDVEIVDKKLPTTIQRLMQFLLLCCCSIIINSVITPWFIVVTIPVVILYYTIQIFYRSSFKELQRLDSITRTPIFSHFAETLSGLCSIRAYGCEDRFIASFYEKLHINTNCCLILNCTNRWLGIVLDYLGGFILLLAMIITLITAHFYPDFITPSLVGLAMNYSLLLPIYLNWVVKFFGDFEIHLGAVERISQYASKSNNKLSPQSGLNMTLSHWSNNLTINFENVTLKYGFSPEPVLVGVNLHIPYGQKIGICGRSGSGKSTLALSIFNMLEISEGSITINGCDVRNIPASLLRTIGSIIPQDTLFFKGSVRENLDAPGICTEEQIWNAIDNANLRGIIQTHFQGSLDAEMNAGQCLSGGEKQLFSLARAILHKPSFLIMDEATSNLDKESEQMLMSTAQNMFQGKTMIIIAHRLSTVLDCDRIIVLEKGKVMEDGTPCSLLSINLGIFSSMVRSSKEGFLVP